MDNKSNTNEMKTKADVIVNEMRTKKTTIEKKIDTTIKQVFDVTQKKIQMMYNIDEIINRPGSNINKIIGRARNLDNTNEKVLKYNELSYELTALLNKERESVDNEKREYVDNEKRESVDNEYQLSRTYDELYELHKKLINRTYDELYKLYKQHKNLIIQPNLTELVKLKGEFDKKLTNLNSEVDKLVEINKNNYTFVEEVTAIYDKLVKIANDLDESGITKPLTYADVMANLRRLISEEVARDKTKLANHHIEAIILAGLTSHFTLEEIKDNDISFDFTNNNGKFCGEHEDGNREVAGQVCVEVITQCLAGETPLDCLKKWNGTDWSHGIKFSNIYKPVAEKLAIHLGLDTKKADDLVRDFNNAINEHNKNAQDTDKRKQLNGKIVNALRALEKTVNSVPDADKTTANKTTAKVGHIPMYNRDNNIFELNVGFKGGSNKNNSSDIAISYANFIRNTYALKNMVSMTGGTVTKINNSTVQVIRRTWKELNKLMATNNFPFSENAKKTFDSDVDSLARSVQRVNIITKYLEIVKQLFTDNSFTKYLAELGINDSKELELSIVDKLVEKYNKSNKAGGKKLENIANTFSNVDLQKVLNGQMEAINKIGDKFEKQSKESMEYIKQLGNKLESMDSKVSNPYIGEIMYRSNNSTKDPEAPRSLQKPPE